MMPCPQMKTSHATIERIGSVIIVPALKEHFQELLPLMHPDHRRELEYSTGLRAEKAAARAFAFSQYRLAALKDGRCIALGGVQTFKSNPCLGAVWLFGTKELDAIPLTLVRIIRRYSALVQEKWTCILNVLPPWLSEETSSMRRLLERCGFEMKKPIVYEATGQTIYPFMSKKTVK